jgi:hypothetical protein
MAKKKLSRDQKRRQKLAKRDPSEGMRAQRQAQMNHFRSETEQIIHDTFLNSMFRMFDADAREAVKQLMIAAQKGDATVGDAAPASAVELLAQNVKRRWAEQRSLEKLPLFNASQALQALVTHIESIMAQGDSQSYLRYLQGVTKGAAALVEGEPIQAAAKPNDWSPAENELRRLGLAWLRNSNEETWKTFQTEAMRLVDNSTGRAVAHVCQYLYGLIQQDPVEKALRPLLDAAHRQIEQQRAASETATPTEQPMVQPTV